MVALRRIPRGFDRPFSFFAGRRKRKSQPAKQRIALASRQNWRMMPPHSRWNRLVHAVRRARKMIEAIWKTLLSRTVILAFLGLFVLFVGVMWLIDPDAFSIKGPFSTAQAPETNPPTEDAKTPLTQAERIARLQSSIDAQ